MTGFEKCWGIYTGKGLARKQTEPTGRRMTEYGWVWVQKQAVEGNNPCRGHRRVYEGERACVRVSHGDGRGQTSTYKIQMGWACVRVSHGMVEVKLWHIKLSWVGHVSG